MLNITTIDDAIQGLANIEITGIGISAFSRIMPGILNLPKYNIFCHKRSMDIHALQQLCKISVVEENLPTQSTGSMIQTKIMQEYFKQKPKTYLYIYKSSNKIDTLCKELGISIIGNTAKIRDQFEDKKEFRKILSQIGIAPIKGETISYKQFKKSRYEQRESTYNEFVIQLPDIKNGGGQSTFFIKNEEDFIKFQEKINKGSYKNKTIEWINITKFITGISASITCCATQYGTLTSTIQTQIIDIPETINLSKGTGLFCGHDWSFKLYSQSTQDQAEHIAETLGNYMYKSGYKGIFGLDLLIDGESVYVVECNPRYTGAFPTTSIIDKANLIIPMDIFHLYELLNIPYAINFTKINQQYKYRKKGSHILLCNRRASSCICIKDLLPGIYIRENGHIMLKKDSINFEDLSDDQEFIIVDGLPRQGETIGSSDELSRFCRLIFKTSIIENNNTLKQEIKDIIDYIYSHYLKDAKDM